jgi:hypothetical protein
MHRGGTGTERIARVAARACGGEVQQAGCGQGSPLDGSRHRHSWRSVNSAFARCTSVRVHVSCPFTLGHGIIAIFDCLSCHRPLCALQRLCCAPSPEALRHELHEVPMRSTLQHPQRASSTRRERQLLSARHPYWHEPEYHPQSDLSQAQPLPHRRVHQHLG